MVIVNPFCAMVFSHYDFAFGTHHDKDIIFVRFAYDKNLIQELRKKFPIAQWSRTHTCWYLPDRPAIRETLQLPAKEIGKRIAGKIHPVNRLAFQEFIDQLMLKAYSPKTIKNYVCEFSHLLIALKHHPVNDLPEERLKDYFLYCVKNEGIKERQLNSRINAIKFYFEKVLYREKMFFDIPRPKTPSTLPKILTKAEIKKIFANTFNPKHLLMLQLSYGMGLRVSEIVNLKVEHINSEDMLVHISGAKGKKDRYTQLPQSVLHLLREYYKAYRPKEWLFEGQYGGSYSVRSVQTVFKNAMKKAGISKTIGIHGLRHSYATHLLSQGADIRFIKDLLGHQSIKTTEIYTHITDVNKYQVKSPLDTL